MLSTLIARTRCNSVTLNFVCLLLLLCACVCEHKLELVTKQLVTDTTSSIDQKRRSKKSK